MASGPEIQEVVPTTKLSDEHLPMLLNLLHSVAGKWEMIATFLKMRPGSIAVIKAEQTNAEKKLFDIMKRWLNETNPAPTVLDLVDVLRTPFIGENQIARNIEKEFYPQSSSKLCFQYASSTILMINVCAPVSKVHM